MKPILEVIEARIWSNSKTNRVASIYGAVPWTSNTEREDWKLIQIGFTWRTSSGTVGIGRQPCATREEAEQVMNQINAEYEERVRLLRDSRED